ncbi:MAG: FkbM family methyltransferase [Armatimonadetes bacterium]|nr:FkbM family methyltransferase [Armatimonadota bacterium]
MASWRQLRRRAEKRIAHGLTRLFFPIVLPIREGPLQGKRWVVTSGIRFIRGNYEPAKTEAYLSAVKEGDVVFDVGAHVGYYSTIACQNVGKTGRVFAFEPHPLLNRFLKRHKQLNHLDNLEIITTAVGEKAGKVRFETRCGLGTGHIAEDGAITVPVVSLDELVEQGRLPIPNVIKMDVEGAEIRALKGASKTVGKYRPTIIVATHGAETHEFCIEFLTNLGYTLQHLNPNAIKGDREILATPPAQSE